VIEEYGSSGWTRTSNPPVNSHFFRDRSRQFGAIWPVFIGVLGFGELPETTRDRAKLSRFCPSATVTLKLTRCGSTSLIADQIDQKLRPSGNNPEGPSVRRDQRLLVRSFQRCRL
jgi:hypothetical protein